MSTDPLEDHPDLARLDALLDREAERHAPAAPGRLARELADLADALTDPAAGAAAMFGAPPHGAFVLLVNPDGVVRVLPIGPVDADLARVNRWFSNFTIGATCFPNDDGSGEPLFLRAALFADSQAGRIDAAVSERERLIEEFVREHPYGCDRCGCHYRTERGLLQHQRLTPNCADGP